MRRGIANVAVLAIVAALGVATWLFKPKMLSGESKRAERGVEASAKVENTAAKVDDATKQQAASAAASVAIIAKANSMAPDSPTKDFIGQEAPVALAKLPAPDPQALLDAEKRRSAVMEGRLIEAKALYEAESKKAVELSARLAVAIRERQQAFDERQKADEAISEAAAANLATERQRNGFILVAVLLIGLWAYTKLYSIGPASLGNIAADIRAGVNPIHALDTHLAPWLHAKVADAVKLSADLGEHK